MKRGLLSLYLLLVVSVVALGALTEFVWRQFAPEPPLSSTVLPLMRVLESLTTTHDPQAATADLQARVAQHGLEVRVLGLDELASSSLLERLESGSPVTIHEAEGHRRMYLKFDQAPLVLEMRVRSEHAELTWVYRALILFFYAMLGLLVLFWFWPLARDLRMLRESTRHLGHDARFDAPVVRAGSAIAELQQAYVHMSARITDLLSTQKIMTHAISHELRTPLARMKFTLDSLGRKIGEDDAGLLALGRDVRDMESLIAAFLSFAALEKQGASLNLQCGDMAAMIEELLAQKREVSPLNYALVNSDGATLWRCEWQLMEHAVRNLLNNAQRYAQHTIRVRLESCDERYCIVVEDDGPGVPDALQDTLFDAFVRGPCEQDSGFGLGLALVKKIMEWHGGDATVTRSELGGAQFTLAWPKTG